MSENNRIQQYGYELGKTHPNPRKCHLIPQLLGLLKKDGLLRIAELVSAEQATKVANRGFEDAAK